MNKKGKGQKTFFFLIMNVAKRVNVFKLFGIQYMTHPPVSGSLFPCAAVGSAGG